MAKVEVREVPYKGSYILELYHEGVFIGEYERSFASEDSGDRAAKVREAEGASDLLIEASRRTSNGKIAVRWNGEAKPRRKEIRTYAEDRPHNPGYRQFLVALIPRAYWRKP